MKPVKRKECDPKLHVFRIVHGVGHHFGIPMWKCRKCKKTIFAS